MLAAPGNAMTPMPDGWTMPLPGGGHLVAHWAVLQQPPAPTISASERLELALRLASAFDLPAAMVIGDERLLAMVEDADREWLRGVQSRVLST